MLERQADTSRQGVELLRRGVAQQVGEQPGACRGDLDALAGDDLRVGVDGRHVEQHPVHVDLADRHGVVGLGGRHARLDHEATAGTQQACHGGDTGGLCVGRGQGEERVEAHEHDGERSIGHLGQGGGHVALDAREAVGAGLGPQALEHGGRSVEARDGEAPVGQRQRQAAGAHAQFQDGAAVGQGDDSGGALVGRADLGDGHPAAFAVPVVVHVGVVLAVGLGPVVLHIHSLARRRQFPVA